MKTFKDKSMITQAPNIVKDIEQISSDILKQPQPSWLKEIRQKSYNRFLELGIPTTKDEEWKYTNLAAVSKSEFSLATKETDISVDQMADIVGANEIKIVFINGRFSKKLSNIDNLPQGLKIFTLDEAFSKDENNFKDIYSRYDQKGINPFVYLTDALASQGTYIAIAEKVIIKKLIHIIHFTSCAQEKILILPRTLIHAGKSSEVTILESHIGDSDKDVYLASTLTDIQVEENAIIHYCKSEKESSSAFHIGNTRVWQERNSKFDGFSFMTGAAIARNNLDIVLNGQGADAQLKGLYSLYNHLHADNHTSVDHRFPNCTSNQLYKGVLNGSSRAVFNGKIFVRQIAQQTNSYQLNKNLLLGKDSRVDTKPQLEIFADDVKCTHGATIGQLNEDEIFYLESRSIARKEAVRMLSIGFVEDVINHIESDEIKTKLHKLLEPSFAQF